MMPAPTTAKRREAKVFMYEGVDTIVLHNELAYYEVLPVEWEPQARPLEQFIAQAQIDYDGKGFVSRSAKPGIINRILSFLGIG